VRIGLIADIHGNLFALDAVLAELERERLDEVVCLGDVAVGPQPGATLSRLREVGCPVVMGNWDAYFLSGFPSQSEELARMLVEMGEWWARQLSPTERAYIESFERTLERRAEGTRLVAFHGSPRSFEDFIFATTPDDELEQMLDGCHAPLLAGGHTHFAMIRRHQGALLVNPGSVGLPFADRRTHPMRISPWTEYAIVEIEDGKLSVDLRRTSFDVAALLDLIRESGMPHAEWWASLWVTDRS
jgi:putative phosphoesterase